MNEAVASYSFRVMTAMLLLIISLLVLSSFLHRRIHLTKRLFYILLTSTIIIATVALVMGQVLLFNASGGGLEKRTARLNVLVCGQPYSIATGSLLSSRVGNSRLYVEGDTITVQGIITDEQADASLGALMQSIGGSISSSVLVLPAEKTPQSQKLQDFLRTTPNGSQIIELKSGLACDLDASEINVFAYQLNDLTQQFTQTRISRPDHYIFSKHSKTNQQDCIVIEFGKEKTSTAERCGNYPESYAVQKEGSSL